MTEGIRITSPIELDVVEKLTAVMRVLISGIVYTARDAAHKRLVRALEKGEPLPFDLNGQTIYYLGPSPTRPGAVIGAAGPTTSVRMDTYTPRLLAAGVKAVIGKGGRSPGVREALRLCRAVYFVATGGAGALLARSVRESSVVAYADLGTEAVRRLVVSDFPAMVADDVYGGDLFLQGKTRYQRRG